MKSNQSSVLGRALHGFFTDFLPQQRSLRAHTICSYRDSLKLFLQFLAGPSHHPCGLEVPTITPERVLAFLQHLETKRRSQPSTRNVRLSAIHSFFRYVGSQHPQHLKQAQRILSVPFKRAKIRQVQALEPDEVQAVLDVINLATSGGRRDLVLLSLLFNTGAHISEIVDLKACDLQLVPPPSVLLHGKERKPRICPIWPETARLLRQYLEEHAIHSDRPDIIFRNHLGTPLTQFGVRAILTRHAQRAAQRLPSLKSKRIPSSLLAPQHGAPVAAGRGGSEQHCPLAWP